jgi:murein L,D-transpeptidase YcbB/YkuD
MKVWWILGLLLPSFFFTGCERVNRDGYSEFRRSTDRFQVADQPAHRFKLGPTAVSKQEQPIAALSEFELPETRYEITRPKEILPSTRLPKPAEPFEIPRARNSRPPDPAPIQAVPQSHLPKPDVNIQLSKKDIQYLLKELGYYTGKIDGVFGPKTKSAVKKFQQNQGLVVDGVVGRKTRAALMLKLRQKYGR